MYSVRMQKLVYVLSMATRDVENDFVFCLAEHNQMLQHILWFSDVTKLINI